MKIELKILNKEFYSNDGNATHTSNADEYWLPSYTTTGSAAIDLVATQDYTIHPGEVVAIHTGLAIHIGSGESIMCRIANEYDNGYTEVLNVAGIILPRSGRGTKEGLVLANTIGLIDEDYQGDIIVQAWNRNLPNKHKKTMVYDFPARLEDNPRNLITIKEGERFAQLAFVPVVKPSFTVVEEFSQSTDRGKGGFGSTDG